MPRGAGAELPATLTGAAVAIADKLDTLVGIFGIGMLPPAAKTRTPCAVRLGVLRILIEKQLDLDLNDAVAFAVNAVRRQGQGCRPGRAVLEFIFDRLRARYEDEGVDVATYLSVRALKPGSALDFDQRVQAVQAFRKLPEAAALAAVNKRVSNLLSKAEGSVPTVVEAKYFDNANEFSLYSAIQQADQAVQPMAAARQYSESLARLAALREPVDAFFEAVMVNAEDARSRQTRCWRVCAPVPRRRRHFAAGVRLLLKLLILDRDGVINYDSDAYIKSVEEWIPLPGSIEAIAQLSKAGWTVAVATNQSGIARGYYDIATLDAMHAPAHAGGGAGR
jgi:glycyl-tRNA synthetase beta subunit